ncbi:hypothetical protein Taro_038835 [Colocasia esculenta]|uniref:Chlororespiratory reduction 21 n=1 Tax=Colocasia esculenta TaxID=4460 RepID=A0A843WKD5_COLES|nr:hypothetical protein [Colocasia esculenta]
MHPLQHHFRSWLPSLSTPPSTALSPHARTIPARKSSHSPATHVLGLHYGSTGAAQSLRKSFLHRMSFLCKDGLLGEAFSLLYEMESEGVPVGPEFYGELLQGCIYERALPPGRQIHARVVKRGDFFHKNDYLETKLVVFYAKCDGPAAASRLFVRQRRRNVFSWAAMIGLHCREGFSEDALVGFCDMMCDGFLPDNFVIPNALKACSAVRLLGCGREIHGFALKMGFGCCVFVQSSLVDFYGKLGSMEAARKVFIQMPEKNVVTWNSMLVGYTQNGLDAEAMKIFHDMRVENVEPTRVTIASVLSASANLQALHEGRQSHAVAVLCGLELDNILSSSLINFYCKVGWTEDAELVFGRTLETDMVIWNLLVSGYVRDGQIDKAFHMYHKMREENLRFDSVTLASILSACADTENLKLGKEGHGYSIRNSLQTDLAVASSTVDMYAKCGRIELARLAFDTAVNRDLILWNTLISAYAQCGLSGEATRLFYHMQLEGVTPDIISWNSVLLGLMRSGQVDEAYDMFSQLQSSGEQPNLVTWTTLISGFAQNGHGQEAIEVFVLMQERGLRPNAASIVGVTMACTDIASLLYGKAIHGYIMRQGLLSSPQPQVVTSLVDMYAKCGNVYLSRKTFDLSPRKELPLYNALISGYAVHGLAEEALALFMHMHEQGIKPDAITFTGLLSACSHAGLVDEGLEVFTKMVSEHNLCPCMEHYGCVTTILARQGNIEEAIKLISEMPFKPDTKILGSLLAACKENHLIELSKYLSRYLFEREPENQVNYVTLSNTYAADGKWNEASKTRGTMKEKGLQKDPGCSWIHLGTDLHTFVATDMSHPQTDLIYEDQETGLLAMPGGHDFDDP